MNVRVTILVSSPPSKSNLDSLKSAASELTNKQSSIKVQTKKKGSYYALVTDFMMKTMAQDKVVDDIDKKFKFWTWDLEGYQDSIIEFPK